MSEGMNAAAPPPDATRDDVGPPMLLVTMGSSRVVAVKAPLYSLTRHETETGEGFGVLTLSLVNGVALYFELDALNLRNLAAACLIGANRLDGGRGKQ